MAFNDVRQSIIDGLDSAQSEANGWNNKVRDAIGVDCVVRTSDTVVTITLPPLPQFNITSQETITVTVPSAALTGGGGDVVASPTFVVTTGTNFDITGLTCERITQ